MTSRNSPSRQETVAPTTLVDGPRSVKDAIVRSRNETEQLQLIVQACSQAIGDGACSVWLAKRGRRGLTLELSASCGYDHNYEELAVRGGRLPFYSLRPHTRIGITGWIFRERRSFQASLRADFDTCSEHRGRYDRIFWNPGRAAESFYGTYIPAASGVNTHGVIKVEHREHHRLDDPSHQALIEVVAAALGCILDTSRLEALTRALAFFAEEVPTQNPYDDVVELCRTMTGAEAASLFILDRQLNRLVMRGDAGHDRHLVWCRDTHDLKHTYGPEEEGQPLGLTWEVFAKDNDGVITVATQEQLEPMRSIWASRLWQYQWNDPGKPFHSLYMRRIGAKGRAVGVIKVENKLSPRKESLGQRFSDTDQKMLDAFSRALEPLILLRESALEEIGRREQYTDVFGDAVLRQILELGERDITQTGLAGCVRYQDFHDAVRMLAQQLRIQSALAHPSQTISDALAKEILPKARIPSELTNLFVRLTEAEDSLLYRQERYRDHAVHAFNVFMLGYAILTGLHAEVVRNMQNRLDHAFGSGAGRVDLIQAWTLASIFHDVGQPVQRVHDWVSRYLESFFDIPEDTSRVQPMVQTLVRLDFLHHSNFSGHMSTVIEAVQQCLRTKQRERVHDALATAVNTSFNHGIVSSLLVLDQLIARKARVNGPTARAAAAAMCLHDSEVWKAMKTDWINVHEELDDRRLSWFNQPLAFLLMFCDNAQEWGRVHVGVGGADKTMDEAPRVHKLDVTPDRVYCELWYDDPSEDLKQTIVRVYHELELSWSSLEIDRPEWELRSRQSGREIEHAAFLTRGKQP